MKKKILAFSLVISLLAIAVVGGTLAWFTDTDSVENTFTVGSVKVEQNETDKDGTAFVQDQPLLPIVKVDEPTSDPNFIDKIVTVKNTGKNSAYLRTFIAVPKDLGGNLHLQTRDQVEGNRWDYVYTVASVEIEGIKYTVYAYEYNTALAKDETTDVLLQGVYLDAKVDVQLNETSGKMEFCWKDANGDMVYSGFAVEDSTKVNVLVATQAVQADGFGSAHEAIVAAFGDNVTPWDN